MPSKAPIDSALAQRLIAKQFPQWQELPVNPVIPGGWDNRSFRLGDEMLIRLPSRQEYAAQVEKEQQWLPRLAPFLPLEIPKPLAMGKPDEGYPWNWSIYRWIEGEPVSLTASVNLVELANSLAEFLNALHKIDTRGGPRAGAHSFYRGGSLKVYDTEMRQALELIQINAPKATEIWEKALSTRWQGAAVWVHGDVSAGNLLLKEGKLSAVIDFGQLAVGDPACDLVIAWTLFQGQSRELFRKKLNLDSATWLRATAWALWKASIVAAGLTDPNNFESLLSRKLIEELLDQNLFL